MSGQSDFASRLRKTGLSEKEALVYATLVTSGGAYPSYIAEETRLNRTTVYKILLDLSIKGLVSELKKRNKLYYQVGSPDRLLQYAKGQLTQANAHLEAAEKLLPAFEGLYSAFLNKPKVTYFEGALGAVAIYGDMVTGKERYEMLAFSNMSAFEHVMPKKFYEDFRRAKERIGITTRGILPETENDRTFVERNFAGYKEEIRPRVRFVANSVFPFKGEITVYGTKKVAIVNLNEEHLTGIIIEDETIHNMMAMIFELSWKGAAGK